MKYSDTRNFMHGYPISTDEAACYNTYAVHDCALALENITASTALLVAYVNPGKSTATDWQFDFTRIGAGAVKYVPSLQEYNVAAVSGGSYSTPNYTWTHVDNGYVIVKVLLAAADTLTLTYGVLVNCATRQTSTTVISLAAGCHTLLVKNGTTNDTNIAFTTGGAGVSCSAWNITDWTIDQLEILY
jgi:hypothetical protein